MNNLVNNIKKKNQNKCWYKIGSPNCPDFITFALTECCILNILNMTTEFLCRMIMPYFILNYPDFPILTFIFK